MNAPAPRSAREVEEWLMVYLSKELGIKPAELDAHAKLVDLGLGSRKSVILAGDLEDWLGISLAPDLLWDHPTVSALAAHLGRSETPAT